MCAKTEDVERDLVSVAVTQDEGESQADARAAAGSAAFDRSGSGEDAVVKKRKTRRGKPKRRNPNPYVKPTWQQRKMNNRAQFNRKFRSKILSHAHAPAPFNSNQFLMEDHGEVQDLDDKLNMSNGVGTSVPSRTRDSSFSVDSDADFYSSPEDEEEFLTKEFDNAYADLHNERLQAMSKDELIQDYLQLERKVEVMTKRLRVRSNPIEEDSIENIYQQQLNKLILENDALKRENEHLRSGVRSASSLSSSVDSESDSSSSTCNSSSSASMKSASPSPEPDVKHETNGFPSPQRPNSTVA